MVSANFREELRSYPVRYYSEGEEVYTETEQYGSTPSLAEPEAREGYTFAGWYLDEEYAHPASIAAVQGETKLYAKWEPVSSQKPFPVLAVVAVAVAVAVAFSVLAVGAVITLVVVIKHRTK